MPPGDGEKPAPTFEYTRDIKGQIIRQFCKSPIAIYHRGGYNESCDLMRVYSK